MEFVDNTTIIDPPQPSELLESYDEVPRQSEDPIHAHTSSIHNTPFVFYRAIATTNEFNVCSTKTGVREIQ